MKNTNFQEQLQNAENLFVQGHHQEALQAFLHLNSLYPDSSEVSNNLGVTYYTLGELEQASYWLQQAANLDPNFQEAQDNLDAVREALQKSSGTQETATHSEQDTTDTSAASESSKSQRQDCYPIRTKDGLTVCAPKTLECMTSFVLLEQEDWFEPEIDFVRQFAQPGMTVLDIGACFGVYALPLASLVGLKGKVFALEPGQEAREYLEKSLQENSLANIEILPWALSNQAGQGWLLKGSTPEKSSPAWTQPEETAEAIQLTTLDAWWQDTGQPSIDIIKLDASGHEAKILQGGADFFTHSSPLILFNCLQEDGSLNSEAITCLQEYGYEIFQYIPGPGALTPFASSSSPGNNLLNLVAAPKDKLQQLTDNGLVVTEEDTPPDPAEQSWQTYLEQLPWTQDFLLTWRDRASQQTNQNEILAVNHLCAAQLQDTPKQHKYNHLLQAAKGLMQLFNSQQASGPVALSLARALNDLGLRDKAVQVLQQLLQLIEKGQCATFNLPFLPPLQNFDHKQVHSQPQNWIMARCLESIISLRHYSGYFSSWEEEEILNSLIKNPDHSIEYERLLALSLIKSVNNPKIEQTNLTPSKNEDNNTWFWKEVYNNKTDYQKNSNSLIKKEKSKYHNIFVLGTGRCGTVSFVTACKHIENYTASHESRVARLGEDRLNYPENHIEADNRLSWLLGRLDHKFGEDAFYVHLLRDPEATAKSYAKRQFPGGILRAYGDGILMPRVDSANAEWDAIKIAKDLVDTVTQNINLFLKDKPNVMVIHLEKIDEHFLNFWEAIGAEGEINLALKEIKTPKNVSH